VAADAFQLRAEVRADGSLRVWGKREGEDGSDGEGAGDEGLGGEEEEEEGEEEAAEE
jgi:hypothetical protein